MRAEWSVADVCAMSAVPAVRYATERIEMLLANARTGGSRSRRARGNNVLCFLCISLFLCARKQLN